MRLLLDTCAVIDLLTDADNLGKGALDLIGDPEGQLFASFETMREIIVHYNNKEHLTLLSSDQKFPYYRDQGLDLIEY